MHLARQHLRLPPRARRHRHRQHQRRDYYEFKTQRYCAERLDWEHSIALRSRTGTFVCSGYDAEIYVPDAVGAAYCPVYDMRKLSPAEVTAMRARR